ncbi:efflux RND transporter periplasmic adaptor subunit [Nitrospirillum viridazoti]|uniref:RND family efflux transporter MFP subunit n=1 Tax=Nitrospirillum amazonense TaxID=28077 RepID=A0A560IKX9_9PROT|nr:efflux RND transporter periplasmic adaptor subunit [Nitrospirillum amazonense]TWB59597.1 RND family efflux transporter MFP subunit [Nitrospirillum amazonense]
MQRDKAELLRSIAIDRTAPSPARQGGGGGRGLILGLGVGAAVVVVAAGIAWSTGLLSRFGGADPAPAAVSAKPAPTAAGPAQSAPAAPVSEVRSGNLIGSGYVVARRVATVSADVTGRVREVLVQEGMLVQKGQVLATLDDVLARSDLDLARARQASAEAAVVANQADLVDAEKTLERTRALTGRQFSSEADLIKADARAASLRAQLVKSKADVNAARATVAYDAEMVDRYQVRAPFTGVVTEKNAQPGEIISPMSSGGFTRTGVCTLVDMDSLEFEVEVNEANIARVRPGQKVEATLDAYPDWKVPASVLAIIPTASREKATIKVRVAIAAKDPRILPNMAAKVTFLNEGKGG